MSAGDITRGMEATAARGAARVERQRRALPNGWWAMALLIATEATLFGSLIASYFYLRFQVSAWPPHGIPSPSVTLPLVLTGILLASTLPLYAAVQSAAAGRVARAWLLVVLAMAIQGAYLGLQIHLFADDLASFSPTANAYGSIYFTLLAIHHAHVAVGLLLEVWIVGKLLRGLTNYRVIALRIITMYWYFVALVGVAVVFTQLYPSL
jgi:cytochrome c oxidase subunit 3/cytochrome c oxidase subunit I+III